jgi:superfamily II DNA/RNA helicase
MPRPTPPPHAQALVVAPSQELAMQIVRAARGLLPEAARPAVQQLIGGANASRQREALKRSKPLVGVGTPGRLAKLMHVGSVGLRNNALIVLDEARPILGPPHPFWEGQREG